MSELKVSVLRLPAVLARVGLTKKTVYAMVARGEFPAPIKLGVRAVGWHREEVERWLAERPRVVLAAPRPRMVVGRDGVARMTPKVD